MEVAAAAKTGGQADRQAGREARQRSRAAEPGTAKRGTRGARNWAQNQQALQPKRQRERDTHTLTRREKQAAGEVERASLQSKPILTGDRRQASQPAAQFAQIVNRKKRVQASQSAEISPSRPIRATPMQHTAKPWNPRRPNRHTYSKEGCQIHEIVMPQSP